MTLPMRNRIPSFRMLCSYVGMLLCLWGGVSPVPVCATDCTSVAITRVPSSPPGCRSSFETFPLNIRFFRLVNNHHTPTTDRFFIWYRYLGSGYVLIPLLFLVWRMRPDKVTYFLLAVGLESLVVYGIKYFWCQPRPALVLEHVHLLQPLYTHSFPSGDTGMAFAIAGSLLVGEKCTLQLMLLIYAALIAYERIYVGVHFPLDVVVGAIIGSLSAYGSFRIMASAVGQRLQHIFLQWNTKMRFAAPCLLFTLLLTASPHSVWAIEAPPPMPLSLSEAIRIGQSNRTLPQAAIARLKSAGTLPNLTVSQAHGFRCDTGGLDEDILVTQIIGLAGKR